MNGSLAAPARRASIGVLALAALLSALLAMAMPHHPAGASEPSTHNHGHASKAHAMSSAELTFHDEMRKLWEDHVTWTRLAIVTFVDDSASFDATAARLLQNQQDIGDAIKPYYGPEAGEELTSLLQDHIAIAVEILQAAKAGQDSAVTAANERWARNANDIADFLSAANPREWPRSEMRAAMQGHLEQTLREAVHELTGDYQASVEDYEEIHEHILAMADDLTSGIIATFPKRFR